MNDLKLIRAAQKGEKKAFQELISLYYPFVNKFLLKLSKNPDISEDIVQETFLKLIQKIDLFDVKGNAIFSTYVITIAKNTYVDYMRKNKYTSQCFDEQKDSLPSYEMERDVENKLEYQELIEKLKLIPPEQALAIKLKYLEQLTLKEIAAYTSSEPKTIKSRIHNGKKKLRQINDKN